MVEGKITESGVQSRGGIVCRKSHNVLDFQVFFTACSSASDNKIRLDSDAICSRPFPVRQGHHPGMDHQAQRRAIGGAMDIIINISGNRFIFKRITQLFEQGFQFRHLFPSWKQSVRKQSRGIYCSLTVVFPKLLGPLRYVPVQPCQYDPH